MMSGHKTENSENNFIEKTALTIVPDDALSASSSEEETPVDDLHVTDVTIVQGDHPAGPVPGEESASMGKASADNAYVTDVTIVGCDSGLRTCFRGRTARGAARYGYDHASA